MGEKRTQVLPGVGLELEASVIFLDITWRLMHFKDSFRVSLLFLLFVAMPKRKEKVFLHAGC